MSKNMNDTILENLNGTYSRKELIDLHLVCNGKVFETHLAILYSSCKYFAEKIDSSDKRESLGKNKIACLQIDEISPLMLEIVLNFIYSGKVEGLGWSDVYEIMKAAKVLNFDCLFTLCYNFIKSELSCSTLFQTYQFAKKYEMKVLLDLCQTFIAFNFLDLFQNENLNEINYVEFNTIICDHRLIIRKIHSFLCDSMYESTLIKCIKKWVNLNSERKQYEHLLESNVKSTLQLSSENFKIYSVPHSDPFLLNRAYGNHWDIDLYENNPRLLTHACYPPSEWLIKGMIFLIVPNWEDRNVIAGINIIYKNRATNLEETYNCFPEQSTHFYQVETMLLEDDENIIGLTISHGWMIYSLSITTSRDRLLGPYGSTSDDVESYLNLRRQTPLALYMHGFSYVPCKINSLLYMNKVRICVATLDRKKYLYDFMDFLPKLEIDRLERLIKVDLTDLHKFSQVSRTIMDSEQWDTMSIPTLRERPRTAVGNLIEIPWEREIIHMRQNHIPPRRVSVLSPFRNFVNNILRRFR